MADITISSVSVADNEDRLGQGLNFGETVTLATPVYKNTSGVLMIGDATDAAKDEIEGIALLGGSSGEPALLAKSGMKINVGAVLTKRQSYVLSPNNPGKIAPITDLGVGDYLTYLGYAESTSVLVVQILVSGVTD